MAIDGDGVLCSFGRVDEWLSIIGVGRRVGVGGGIGTGGGVGGP